LVSFELLIEFHDISRNASNPWKSTGKEKLLQDIDFGLDFGCKYMSFGKKMLIRVKK